MSYSFQTFSVGQVLTSSQMNQVEVNIRDHRLDGGSSLDMAAMFFASPGVYIGDSTTKSGTANALNVRRAAADSATIAHLVIEGSATHYISFGPSGSRQNMVFTNDSGGIYSFPGFTGDCIATQAEQEAGTSVNKVVAPGRQQYHPSAAKAWCMAQWDGNSAAGYNISSVTDNGAGNMTINYTTSFSSASYVPLLTANGYVGTPNAHQPMTIINSQAAGSVNAYCASSTTGALQDSTYMMFAAFGDQ